jgi:hypothetical protein
MLLSSPTTRRFDRKETPKRIRQSCLSRKPCVEVVIGDLSTLSCHGEALPLLFHGASAIDPVLPVITWDSAARGEFSCSASS